MAVVCFSTTQIVLQGTRILEVGCGVGFLGLHVVKSLPDVASYTFTDGHPEVIKFVNYNIDLNFPSIQKTRSDESQLRSHMHSGPPDVGNSHPISSGCALIVDQLDWTKDHMRDYTVDWILGADVVYERSLIAPLCGVLRRLLKANQSAKALIACTERSATTLKCFEAALTDSGLGYTIIARGSFTPADNIFCSDVKHQLTRVYSIK
jgi:predicted nicotinamide N-methyase